MNLTMGHAYACFGLGMGFILASIGSSIGVGRAGRMAAALLGKQPDKFSQFLILTLLPATQSMYAFIVAFLGLVNMNIIGDTSLINADFSKAQGLSIAGIALTIGFIGLASAIFQGAVGMSGMELCTKQEKQMGRAMTLAALVELFAILAFVISLIGVIGISK